MTVMNGADAEVRVGNCLPLSEIPVGTQIHNIELYPGKGGQLVRSAGNSAQLMAKEGKYATLRLPSGEMRMVPIICRASIGVVGNGEHNLINVGKAGRKRHMGIRPTVRGSVMNRMTIHMVVVKVRQVSAARVRVHRGVNRHLVLRPARKTKLLTS